MKIAFDLRRIGNPGIGRYMKCLVAAILKQESENEYVLILPPETGDAFASNCERSKRIIARSPYYSVREQLELPRILRQHDVDLLHSPHFVLPLARSCPAIATFHDVIYLACPRDLPSRLGRTYYAGMMRAAARSATKIITVSRFSKDEIVRYLGTDPGKIDVIYPGVDETFTRMTNQANLNAVLSKYGIDREYILYAGIYKPRKNHIGLLRAFKYFLACGEDARLVIAGPLDGGEELLPKLAEELSLRDRVVFTGRIDDSELRALYSGARLYACPSLYEGFGFTVLEAMACGVPVVCSHAASLPEVAGDTALYADAADPQAFGKALHRAFADGSLREDLVERGFRNTRRFRWEDAANSCLQVYDDVVGLPVEQVA